MEPAYLVRSMLAVFLFGQRKQNLISSEPGVDPDEPPLVSWHPPDLDVEAGVGQDVDS